MNKNEIRCLVEEVAFDRKDKNLVENRELISEQIMEGLIQFRKITDNDIEIKLLKEDVSEIVQEDVITTVGIALPIIAAGFMAVKHSLLNLQSIIKWLGPLGELPGKLLYYAVGLLVTSGIGLGFFYTISGFFAVPTAGIAAGLGILYITLIAAYATFMSLFPFKKIQFTFLTDIGNLITKYIQKQDKMKKQRLEYLVGTGEEDDKSVGFTCMNRCKELHGKKVPEADVNYKLLNSKNTYYNLISSKFNKNRDEEFTKNDSVKKDWKTKSFGITKSSVLQINNVKEFIPDEVINCIIFCSLNTLTTHIAMNTANYLNCLKAQNIFSDLNILKLDDMIGIVDEDGVCSGLQEMIKEDMEVFNAIESLIYSDENVKQGLITSEGLRLKTVWRKILKDKVIAVTKNKVDSLDMITKKYLSAATMNLFTISG